MKALASTLGVLLLASTALGSPTAAPTSGITPWLVGEATTSLIGSNEFDGALEVSHKIGSDVNTAIGNAVIVELLDSDCVAIMNSTGSVVEISDPGYYGTPFQYNVTVDQSKIASDPDFVFFDPVATAEGVSSANSTGSIKFCTRVSTIEGPIAVAFRETKFEFNFDLTVNGFSMSGVSITENTIDSFETLVDDAFAVEVCQCSNYICYAPGAAPVISQDSSLQLCLYPAGVLPSPIHISNFNLQLSTTTVTYNPVTFGSITWQADILTLVSTDSTGDIVMITTPVIAQFFVQGFTSIQASGNCFLEFDSSKTQQLPDFANFGLDIELAAEVQGGCLQKLMQRLTGMFKDFDMPEAPEINLDGLKDKMPQFQLPSSP